MTEEDRQYLYQRATVEITIANKTSYPMIANIHRQLACAYLARISSGESERLSMSENSCLKESQQCVRSVLGVARTAFRAKRQRR